MKKQSTKKSKAPEKKQEKPAEQEQTQAIILEKYTVTADDVPAIVNIVKDPALFVNKYALKLPNIEEGTRVIIDVIKNRIVGEMVITPKEFLDVRAVQLLKQRFKQKVIDLLKEEIPGISEGKINVLSGFIIHETVGLGTIEFLLSDENLEEIVINTATQCVKVYHKGYGWMETNICVKSEAQTYNYSSYIARQIGRSITNLSPLLDAHLLSGDRVNATLFPISTEGNTITIRKFRRNPWTLPELISGKALSVDVAALVWIAIQYEMSFIVSGGTGSGKTTMLNAFMTLIPASHRVISIEDTRELILPKFLHWVPLTTRESNAEGKGQVAMLDLLINSLRMRPDRIIVGEIRKHEEAEVLFEAIHTGHSVYATLHADTAQQTLERLTNPPINIPPAMVGALPLIVVMFRQRKKGIRRTFEIAEIAPSIGSKKELRVNTLYRWNPRTDEVVQEESSLRLLSDITLYTGMTPEEIKKDMREKIEVLEYMMKKKFNTVGQVGRVVNEYYLDREKLLKRIREE